MKCVIRAGGIGTRLWPYSRKSLPKQFHAFVGDRSMLQAAVDRILPVIATDDIYVSTGAEHLSLVQGQLPDLPLDRIIVEPALRNTGPAIGLECVLLESRFPGCTVASLGSDHYIENTDGFCRLLEAAEAAVEDNPNGLLTLGAKPTRPETGYGYIKKGHQKGVFDGVPVHQVEAFTEKPDLTAAKGFLATGDYLWNCNMFVWKAQTVLNQMAVHEPGLHARLTTIQAALGTALESETLTDCYPGMPSVAIDNAILERADGVTTIEADVGWSDIGSWQAIADVLPADEQGNLLSGDVMALDAENVIVYGRPGKLVALIDVKDLAVIDTDDALLVCPKDKAQRVKDVVARLAQHPERNRLT